jgi:hypothetical protein
MPLTMAAKRTQAARAQRALQRCQDGVDGVGLAENDGRGGGGSVGVCGGEGGCQVVKFVWVVR